MKNKKTGLAILFAVICILCVFVAMGGMVTLAYGIAIPGKSHDVVTKCYTCNGAGTVIKNSQPVTCKVCNGFGKNVLVEFEGEAFAGIGAILLVIGVVGYIVCFIQIKKAKEPEYIPPVQEELSPYAIQVKLFDTSYDTGSPCYAKMVYTFTDADTRANLGRGCQNEIVTLNVSKPTRIKCHLGRGFKDAILNYTPRENAKYKVIPNIYNGLRFEETDSF